MLCLLAGTALASAQDATWIGTAGPNSWNVPSNWSPTPAGPPAYVPSGTAFFNSSLSPSTTVDISSVTTIGGLTFNSAPAYTFTVSSTLALNGAGVSVDAGSATPTFDVSGGGIVLLGSATLGRSNVNLTGAGLTLLQTSSAGSGIITNSNTIVFNDASSAGTATIFNNAGAFVYFNQSGGPLSASAGNATIDNSGFVLFESLSTAAGATVITRSGANTFFFNQSSAGASQQTIMAGGTLTFRDSASAGTATIVNNSNAGAGGLQFSDTASAGSANITNNAGAITSFGASGGTASASNATINNLGILAFQNSSTAGNATITTGPGGTTIFAQGATGGTSHLVINSTVAGFGTVQIMNTTAPTFTIGSLAGTGSNAQFQIGAKTLIVGDNTSTTYQGIIFDGGGSGGGLTKVGTGTLTLAGTASYNGATTILNGELHVTGTLQATSSILVAAGATLSGTGNVSTAGGGTVTVNGTLTPGVSSANPVMVMNSNLVLNATATYNSNFFNGVPTFVFVNGNATLGGTLQIRMDSAGVNFGQAYTVLSSSTPISQQFAALSAPGAYSTSVVYNTTNVQVSFLPNLTGFASGGNANQQATAAAIQAGLIGASKPGAFLPLFNMNQATYLAALTQLSGEIATGAAPTNFKAMDQFMNAMLNPFLDQRVSGLQGPSIAYAPDVRIPPAAQQAFASLPRPGVPPRDERFNVWATGYGGWGKTTGDASTGSSAIDSRVGGGLAGVDFRPVPGIVLGAAAGGALTNYSLGTGNGTSNVAQLGVYGAARLDQVYFAAAFAYGWHAVDTNRTVTLAGSDRISAAFDAYSLNTRAEVGIRQGWREIGFTPFIAAQLQQFHAPAYQEQANGAGAPFAVSYQSNTTNAIRSELGVWFDAQPRSSSGLPISLRARVAWAHNFGDTPIATGAFVSIPSGPFVVTGAKQSADVLLASAAAEWAIERGTWLTARFDTELSRNSSSYSGMGGIRFAW